MSFNDIPHDVIWLIMRRVFILETKRINCIVNWERTWFDSTAHRIVELSLISKKVRRVLKSKCRWKNQAWTFIAGSINEEKSRIIVGVPFNKIPISECIIF